MIEAKIEDFTFQLVREDTGEISINDQPYQTTFHQQAPGLWQISHDDNHYKIFVQEIDLREKVVTAIVNGKKVQVQLSGRGEQLIDQLGLRAAFSRKVEEVRSPMPGLIHAIMVSPGIEVRSGDPLVILEAMKMENVIKAPADGIVAAIHVEEKASVTKNTLLISFE